MDRKPPNNKARPKQNAPPSPSKRTSLTSKTTSQTTTTSIQIDPNRIKVGCAALFQNQELLKCLPNETSIYSAEAIAIDLAMNIIANHKSSKFIVDSDKVTKKALQTHISNTKIPYTNLKPLINKFILKKWQQFWDDQTQNKLYHR